MTDQVWFPRREETHRLVFGTQQILCKYLLMVNEEITARFFKVEKRDGSGTREKLRENFWMFPEPNLCSLCYWKMSLRSSRGCRGSPSPQRASSVRPGSSKRLNEKSRFL